MLVETAFVLRFDLHKKQNFGMNALAESLIVIPLEGINTDVAALRDLSVMPGFSSAVSSWFVTPQTFAESEAIHCIGKRVRLYITT
jgi:hypothetical protein